MEPLKSRLSLRSLDVVEGRPSGTGRSSLLSRGDGPTQGDGLGDTTAEGGTLAGASGFAVWLQRGLTAGHTAERVERQVEGQVSDRLRTEELSSRDGREAAQRADRAEADRRQGSSAERAPRSDADGRRSEEARPQKERRSDEGNAQAGTTAAERRNAPDTAGRPDTRTEARGRALASADAADAEGASSAQDSGAEAAGATNATQGGVAVEVPVAPHGAAAMRGANQAPPAAAPVVAAGSASGAVSLPTGDSAARLKNAEAPRPTAPPAPAPAGPSPEELERAETIMRQLRAAVRFGPREALLELAPRELGRIGVRLAFEDGGLVATVRAERPETLAVLEAHAPELRAWLSRDGTEVRELNLGLGDAQSAFSRSADSRSRERKGDGDPDRRGSRPVAAALERASSNAIPTNRPAHDGGVDVVV
jgi:hypothetical protein